MIVLSFQEWRLGTTGVQTGRRGSQSIGRIEMSVQRAPIVDWVFNCDAPGGVMDTVLEHLQLKPFDASGLIIRRPSPLENARSLTSQLVGEPVIALSVVEEMISADELRMLADQLSPGTVLHVFMKVYVDPKAPNIIARFVPAENHDQFVLKVAGHVHRLAKTQPNGSRFSTGTPVDFPTLSRHFEGFDAFQPLLDERHTVRVEIDSVPFEIFSDLRSQSDKLVIFGQDAINRNSTPLPHFYRWSWLPDLNASAMILNDPSLYASNDLLAGWWVGNRERDFVKDAVSIVAKAARALGIGNDDITFYGASAGGYSSLAMAACLPGARAIVDIPQVCLATYGAKVASDASIRAGLGFENAESVPDLYRHRIDIIDRFIAEEWVPDFLYLQNNRDHTHVGSQMGQFLARLGNLMAVHPWAHSQFSVETYSEWNLLKGGHFPLSRHVSLRRINDYIRTPRDPSKRPMTRTESFDYANK